MGQSERNITGVFPLGLCLATLLLSYYTYKEVNISGQLHTDIEMLNADRLTKTAETAKCKAKVEDIKSRIQVLMTEQEKMKTENIKLEEEVKLCREEKADIVSKIDIVKERSK